MAKVLIIDDESAVRYALRALLQSAGHVVDEAEDGEEGLARAEQADVVITDLVMPRQDGLTVLRRLRAEEPGRPVIMLTARGSERLAVEAIQAGAFDYLVKPFDIDTIEAVVSRAVEMARLRVDARDREAERILGRPMVGRSEVFRQLLRRTARLATRPVPVLVRGETGTGKELIAELLHAYGPRAAGPRVTFNCAAVPSSLAEAELFGHVKGAFTGAETDRVGFFGQADGGTLVLDEVGELPPAVQPKLLRALQSGEIQPVGAGSVRSVDVRVVACTHRDLRHEVAEGRFREDLFYRLAVVELAVPPLRARKEDIGPLAETLRRGYARTFGLPDVPLRSEFVERLEAYDWPGNVRELDNVVAGLMAVSEDGAIRDADWTPTASATAAARPQPGLRERIADFERQVLEETLRDVEGNHSQAARRLGVTRTTILDKLRRHGLR